VEVGLELEDAEHLVCGQSLQVDRAGIHCVWFLNQMQALILLH
jgi:hypothetical protein